MVFDAELLYVSTTLHDIGLVAALDSSTESFDCPAGASHGFWGRALVGQPHVRPAPPRSSARHLWAGVDAIDPEGPPLELATGFDMSGRNVATGLRSCGPQVIRYLPRLGLAQEFTRCFEGQARRKPDSSPAAALRGGIAERIAANPLDAG